MVAEATNGNQKQTGAKSDPSSETCPNFAQTLPKLCPNFARTLPELAQTLPEAWMENSITKSDWLFPHHPIPNAKFQPITL